VDSFPTKNEARTRTHLAKIEQRRVELGRNLQNFLRPSETIVLEIGCGHGHFLTAYATAHPAVSCVGIDIASDRIIRAERKRIRARLGNLHFIQTDAKLFLEELPEGYPLSEVYVLFPDPWPKQRHHKNRLIQTQFLTQLAHRAGKGARLFFRTDYQPYFVDAKATLRQHVQWQIVDEPWAFEHVTVFQERAASFESLVARVRN
jgi:tRNA (guanine-N7-)-methyltransferase